MTETRLSIKRYNQQHYTAVFDKCNGLFVRKEDAGYREPFWCHSGPELLDISITNWCDRYCKICYRDSDENGKHMSLEEYEKILVQASSIGTFQVALGGGNPNQHPDFCDMLDITKNQYGIIPSYTTNGRGLTDKVVSASKKNCGAVAISYYDPLDEFIASLELLKSSNIRTNIHFVLSSSSVNLALEWLESVPDFMMNVNAVVFLNYKAIGSKSDSKMLLNQNKRYIDFFNLINKNTYPFKIGFDSCSISGVVSHMRIDSNYLDPCEAARFSAFISEDLEFFPCSFMINTYQGISLKESSIQDAWQNSKLFNSVRQNLLFKDDKCVNCKSYECCLGGCPFLKNIGLCN